MFRSIRDVLMRCKMRSRLRNLAAAEEGDFFDKEYTEPLVNLGWIKIHESSDGDFFVVTNRGHAALAQYRRTDDGE